MTNPRPPTIVGVSYSTRGGDISRIDDTGYLIDPITLPLPRFWIPGGQEFVWPGGTEDFSLSGEAMVAEHRYIGDDSLIVTVTHLELRFPEFSPARPASRT
jgi:hypothetical protein